MKYEIKEHSGITCICSKCRQEFRLTADEDVVKGGSTHLCIRSCDSGGIYATYIECPHCDYRHDL